MYLSAMPSESVTSQLQASTTSLLAVHSLSSSIGSPWFHRYLEIDKKHFLAHWIVLSWRSLPRRGSLQPWQKAPSWSTYFNSRLPITSHSTSTRWWWWGCKSIPWWHKWVKAQLWSQRCPVLLHQALLLWTPPLNSGLITGQDSIFLLGPILCPMTRGDKCFKLTSQQRLTSCSWTWPYNRK